MRPFLIVIAAVLACTPPKPPPGAAGPLEAVQSFADAVRKGDTAAAWALLSERTQRAADEVAQKARSSAGEAGPESGREMLFASAVPVPPADPHLVSENGASAEVRAGTATFHVVREAGRWRVDLPLGR
jgi:hypothetical protein